MIDLTTLFTRLGTVARVALRCAEFRAAGLTTDAADLLAEYDTYRAAVAPVTQRLPAARAAASDLVPTLVQAAQDTLVEAVRADQSARSWTPAEAAAEVVRQMRALSQTVPACTVGVSATALDTFAGDGLVIVTALGGGSDQVAGLDAENLFAETLWLTCAADASASATGGATLAQEQFRLRGGVAEPDQWGELWPAGSGGDVLFTSADPATDAADAGQQLTNGSFDSFASNVPDNWTIEAGSAGTQILAGTLAQSYDGVNCLALPGNATLAALGQTFGSATGTLAELVPNTRYGLAVRLKASAAPATGALVIELTDSANAVVNDPNGNPLRATIDLTALTTSYAATTAVWVTPRALPVSYKLRVRVGTAIETGKTVYLDHLALVPMVEAYPGGPAVAVVSGVLPFAAGDGWTLAAENDRASGAYGFTWQAVWDRLFGMRALALVLPSTPGGPTYPDSLITG